MHFFFASCNMEAQFTVVFNGRYGTESKGSADHVPFLTE